MKWHSKTCRMKFSSSQNHKVNDKSFMYNKIYRIKFIVITFILQSYILIVKKIYSTITLSYRLV
jgi:hypothetical protein